LRTDNDVEFFDFLREKVGIKRLLICFLPPLYNQCVYKAVFGSVQYYRHRTYMRLMEYSVGTYVKLHTNDTWNDLHGIVDDLLGDVIAVFCITMPLYRYYVNSNDAYRVLELIG